ncbi:MAG: hypothetical protein R8G60_17600 [Roseovarius pacificus]|nr:hypothetical protein [Roseovarius pacificus]
MARNPTHKRILEIISAQKRATSLDLWVPKKNNTFVELRTSLELNGFIESGIDLFIQCKTAHPEENVAVGINIETQEKPKCCARIDWRASPHVNTSGLCGEHKFLDAGQSHFHDPRLHDTAIDVMEFLKQNLPIATALDPEPKDFIGLLETCATLLNVTNLQDTKTPPWQPKTTFL